MRYPHERHTNGLQLKLYTFYHGGNFYTSSPKLTKITCINRRKTRSAITTSTVHAIRTPSTVTSVRASTKRTATAIPCRLAKKMEDTAVWNLTKDKFVILIFCEFAPFRTLGLYTKNVAHLLQATSSALSFIVAHRSSCCVNCCARNVENRYKRFKYKHNNELQYPLHFIFP